MSFFTIEQAPARLNRSELAVPGSQPQMFEKAARSAADVVFLDDADHRVDRGPVRHRGDPRRCLLGSAEVDDHQPALHLGGEWRSVLGGDDE